MDLKKIITIGLTAITLGITSCNQKPKICEDNTEAVEYAVQTGFSIEESELFQPLGKKCTITEEDKEFIRLMYKAKEKGEITPEGLEKIILRFGTEDKTGEQYTISKPELNATKYAYYKIYPEFKSIDSTIKFQEWMIKGFLPFDIGFRLQGIPEENTGGTSFPPVVTEDYTGDGKPDNFMSLPGVLTADSDKIKETTNGQKTGCGDVIESTRQGYDYTLDSYPYTSWFVFPSFTDLEVILVVDEETTYFENGSYSIWVKPKYRDSSLYPEEYVLALAHSYYTKDSSGKNLGPPIGMNIKGIEIDDEGNIIYDQKFLLPYSTSRGSTNLDFNYFTTTPENTIEENKVTIYNKVSNKMETYYVKEEVDPRKPLVIKLTTLTKISEITSEGYILDFSTTINPPRTTNNTLDDLTCKVIYNIK